MNIYLIFYQWGPNVIELGFTFFFSQSISFEIRVNLFPNRLFLNEEKQLQKGLWMQYCNFCSLKSAKVALDWVFLMQYCLLPNCAWDILERILDFFLKFFFMIVALNWVLTWSFWLASRVNRLVSNGLWFLSSPAFISTRCQTCQMFMLSDCQHCIRRLHIFLFAYRSVSLLWLSTLYFKFGCMHLIDLWHIWVNNLIKCLFYKFLSHGKCSEIDSNSLFQ